MLHNYWHEPVIGVLGLLCVGVFARRRLQRRAIGCLLCLRKMEQAEGLVPLLSRPSLSLDRWHGQRKLTGLLPESAVCRGLE